MPLNREGDESLNGGGLFKTGTVETEEFERHEHELALSRLRDYQFAGVRFLCARNSALLADEMGLGKTIQAILAASILLQQSDVNRVLIITPAGLRLNWERELGIWAPRLVVRRLEGNRRSTGDVPATDSSFDSIVRSD